MFDTMTMTKLSAGLIAALLIFLLGNWVAGSLYSLGGGHGGGDHASTGYVIQVAEAETASDDDDADAVPFSELLAAADPDKGKKVWNKCKACHKLKDGANGTGPHLFNLVDRPIAAISGFNYSEALAAKSSEAWTADNLNEWLISPKKFAPGNKMSFSGLKKETDRANLVAYLSTFTN